MFFLLHQYYHQHHYFYPKLNNKNKKFFIIINEYSVNYEKKIIYTYICVRFGKLFKYSGNSSSIKL